MCFTTFSSVLYSFKVFIVKLPVFLFPSLTLFSPVLLSNERHGKHLQTKACDYRTSATLKTNGYFFFTLK